MQVQQVKTGTSTFAHVDIGSGAHLVAFRPSGASAILRAPGETYTQAARRADQPKQTDIVISGIVLDELPWAGEAIAAGGPLDPSRAVYGGQVVVNGSVSGRSSTEGYSFSFDASAQAEREQRMQLEALGMPLSPADSRSVWQFGMGDPIATATLGVGGLAPIVIGGVPAGPTNEYAENAPSGGPSKGSVPPSFAPYLTQKSSAAYDALTIDDPQGLAILGLDKDSGAAFVFVQDENSATFKLNDVRDFLMAQGVDDAVALDSGGASMLVIDGNVLVSPDIWRERTMPMAVHFAVQQ